MKRQQVLFSGYYGFGNAGDEAVLAASVAMFRQKRADLPIRVLSSQPAATSSQLQVEASPRMNPAAIAPQLMKTGLFLSGGGSLLQDRTSTRSLVYYLTLIETARRFGCKTMIFAQGIGPLTREDSRARTARVLSQVDRITVRDGESAELLREIGVKREIEVTADPVFAIPAGESLAVTEATAMGPGIGVSLRPWEGVEPLLAPLAEALAPFAEQGIPVYGWPLYPEEDTPLLEALAAKLPALTLLRGPFTPNEWAALAQRTRVVVGMRLHALIFAAARATPVLGISYDPKVDALLQRVRGTRIGQPGDELDAGGLRKEIERALNEDERRRRTRQERVAHLQSLAERNVEIALELLSSAG